MVGTGDVGETRARSKVVDLVGRRRVLRDAAGGVLLGDLVVHDHADREQRAAGGGRVAGQGRVPGLLGPERGGGLPLHAVGTPGPAAAGVGPERPDVRAPRRPVRRWGTTPRFRRRTTWGAPSPTSSRPTARNSTSPTARSADRTSTCPARTRCPASPSGATHRRRPNGVFNNNQTYTGCVVDQSGNVLANDIATAQGQYPPRAADAWWSGSPRATRRYCIVYGPTPGGYGPHHTDGTGGLAQPGMMALADNGDVLVPTSGPPACSGSPQSSLPTSASAVPGWRSIPAPRCSVTLRGATCSFAAGVAKDPTCDCFAVSTLHRRTRPSSGSPPTVSRSRAGPPCPARRSPSSAQSRPVQPVRHGLRPGRHAVLRRHPHRLYRRSGQLRPGQLRGPGDAGDLHRRAAVDPGGRGHRVRLPDQRDGVRASEADVPVPHGKIVAPLSGPSENSSPDAGPTSDAPAKAGFG